MCAASQLWVAKVVYCWLEDAELYARGPNTNVNEALGNIKVRGRCLSGQEKARWPQVCRWQTMVDDKAVALKARQKRGGCSCRAYRESTMNAEFLRVGTSSELRMRSEAKVE